jgi:hypothetical protein
MHVHIRCGTTIDFSELSRDNRPSLSWICGLAARADLVVILRVKRGSSLPNGGAVAPSEYKII